MPPTNLAPKPEPGPQVPDWLGRLLCGVGLHDQELVDATFGFAPGETIERVRCRRCLRVTTRKGSR